MLGSHLTSRVRVASTLGVGAAVLIAVAAATPAWASHCGGPLQPACPPPPAAGTAPDPGGVESNVSLPPPAGKLGGFSANASARLAGPGTYAIPIAKEYELAKNAGANVHRIDVSWSFVEWTAPSSGTHTYSSDRVDELDTRYAELRARGITPLMVLHSAPQWAQEKIGGVLPVCSSNCNSFVEPAPDKLGDWAAFARFIATRYPAAIYEIWNEPNLPNFYKPKVDHLRYLRVFKTAYDAIKSVRSTATVLSGGLNNTSVTTNGQVSLREYLHGLYTEGIKTAAPDFKLGVHIYPGAKSLGAETYYAKSWDAVVDNMRANGDADRDVWVTETGISTSPEASQGTTIDRGYVATPIEQADIVRRTYNRMMTMDTTGPTGWRPVNVKAVLLYTLRDSISYPENDYEYGFGFLKKDDAFTAKPAYCWAVNSEPAGAPDRTYPGCP